MEEKHIDLVMVPSGLLVLGFYHAWLFFTILRDPTRTVIGLNALARKRWVRAMLSDPTKNGVLAVQTLRNNIMASTVLATTAITLSSLISVFVGTINNTSTQSSLLVYGNKTAFTSSIKFLAISLCFILAFLCNVQSIRYYAHVSFLVTIPESSEDGISVAYVAQNLNRGSFFWSLGLRAFYVSFTLFLWIFGPIPMFVCCIAICSMLYFLDTTKPTQQLHDFFKGKEEAEENV